MKAKERNIPCPCGSGKKNKRCCRRTTFPTSFNSSLKEVKYSKDNYPKGITSSEENPLSKCNVTHCQSTEDVNYKNNWNGGAWYCHKCFVDHTLSDIRFADGYRYEQAEPHPLLTPHLILVNSKDRLRNKFDVILNEDTDELVFYWIKDDGTKIPVPKDAKAPLLVFENELTDGSLKVLLMPHRTNGVKEIPIDLTGDDVLYGEAFTPTKQRRSLKVAVKIYPKGTDEDLPVTRTIRLSDGTVFNFKGEVSFERCYDGE